MAISIIIALWSASGGTAALISGIHVAHEADEPKSFVKKRGKALVLRGEALDPDEGAEVDAMDRHF